MFNFNDAYIPITIDEIKSKVTDYDIFKRYCLNFEELDRSFLSEFYNDTKPSCRIVVSSTGSLYYNDWGNGDYFKAFDYVMYKYSCSLHEVCNIIANDFGLKKVQLNMNPRLLVANDLENEKPVFIKSKTIIKIIKKPLNLVDFNYWGSYGISLETLIKFNIFSCSHVFVEKNGNHWVIESTKTNPIYAYEFNGLYKIYRPLGKKEEKWLTNAGSDILQGYNQLPEFGDLLIITKSLKDVLCLHEMNYSSTALQAETNILPEEIYNNLKSRFKRIISLYDNDITGQIGAQKLLDNYNIFSIFIPKNSNCKDISDYVNYNNLNLGKQLIKQLIRDAKK